MKIEVIKSKLKKNVFSCILGSYGFCLTYLINYIWISTHD